MPVTKKIVIDDGIVGLFKMTETIEELENKYISYFQKIPSISDYKHDRRKIEWIAVRLLISDLIGAKFSIDYCDDGSPRIIHSAFRFISISHSSKYAAVYLHKIKKVGVDVESLDRNFAFIEKKYLSEIEIEDVKQNALLPAIYWSSKEAIFKWAGKVGVDFRKQIGVERFDPDEASVFNAVFDSQEKQFIELSFLVFDRHVLVYTL